MWKGQTGPPNVMLLVHIWRRSYSTRLLHYEPSNPRHPQYDRRYCDLDEQDLPATESLQVTVLPLPGEGTPAGAAGEAEAAEAAMGLLAKAAHAEEGLQALMQILKSIQALLSDPNNKSPAQTAAYDVLKSNPAEYQRMVRKQAIRYPPPEDE
ncbi:2,3-bisphosphoglycerate-dependent phosphoglycerate mutase [Tetrabaena socialis]|uniref:2,3-bisphosphoglycerate-dependent phosphoglycerate mutase n=1 Tax=Tetrabaena socialis TaxID=47790 RepID=A0A2J7ZK02_9CHLO|nr:2,3-bisphosphoglycerate-dependent phosphoglycerate mutase [Tetrabaena socialis]|eukprot:PNH00598.1 2,3-bisphosphoglycerate-dependent phosphoglycerate mutase [Tetrabaena socialis]